MDKLDQFFSEIKQVPPKPYLITRIRARHDSSNEKTLLKWGLAELKPMIIVALVVVVNVFCIASVSFSTDGNEIDLASDFGIVEDGMDDIVIFEE